MNHEITNQEVLRVEKLNGFWIKIASGILTAGILAMISMSYKTTTQIAVMQTDVTHVRETLKNFNTRLTHLESSTFTSKDAEQLRTWTELKLETIKIQLQAKKIEVDNIKRKINGH